MLKTKDENQLQKLIDSLIGYLDCTCRYFPPADDDSDLMTAYREARKRGKKEGFTPMIVTVDDTLWECLSTNSDENSSGAFLDYDPEKVKEYRKESLAAALPDGKEILREYFENFTKYMEEAGENMDDIAGEIAGGEVNDSFSGYWDYFTKKTYPLILAEIPVKNPWEVFAYLPFGGWNECPDTPEQMAVAKYWFELYGAMPAVLTHDVLEYELPQPVGTEKALELAKEQYAFCADIVDQGVETVGVLADMLAKSKVWYFWWD